MVRLLCFALLTTIGLNAAPHAQGPTNTLYIQVLRGTERNRSPEAEWKAIGPKLSQKLSSVFKWKHYWEVKRQKVAVTQEKVTKIYLLPDRDLEIETVKGGPAELRLYLKGELRRKLRLPVKTKVAILGGDSAEDEGWFIVVRRDKPSGE